MTGYLLYDTEGICRNKWFANELIKYAKLHDISLELIIVDKNLDFCCSETPDFVITRVISPQINNYFEKRSIPVFNNYKTAHIANNKWLTYKLAKKLRIPTMETYLPSNASLMLKYPFILKSLDGHGGSEVFKITNDSEYYYYTEQFKNNSLIQEICSDVGKDVRVYCLGKDVIVAILRTSHTDFRSNFSLGGSATLFQPTEAMLQIVQKLHEELNFGLVGIDFIFHNNEWVLNEIEDVVGTRMIYQCTEINVVDKYIEYIIHSIKH